MELLLLLQLGDASGEEDSSVRDAAVHLRYCLCPVSVHSTQHRYAHIAVTKDLYLLYLRSFALSKSSEARKTSKTSESTARNEQ
jgi:hypothetical protein